MKQYYWELVIGVDADDEIEAQEKVEENLEGMFNDPDGPYSFGELKEVTTDDQK